jgi:hypothetical protein
VNNNVDIVDIKFHNNGNEPIIIEAPLYERFGTKLITYLRRAVANEEEEFKNYVYLNLGYDIGMTVRITLNVKPYTEEKLQKVKSLFNNYQKASAGPEKKKALEVLTEELLKNQQKVGGKRKSMRKSRRKTTRKNN